MLWTLTKCTFCTIVLLQNVLGLGVFFGNWIIFLHQSLSGSQVFQQMEWFVYTTWKFSVLGKKANLKQNTVSLMRKFLSLFSVRSLERDVFCSGSSLSQQPAGAFTGLIFIFDLLFRTNASDVRLLYRKRDFIRALCRWLHGLFSKGNRGLARPARAKSQGWALPGSCPRNTLHQPSHGSRPDRENSCTLVLIVKWIFQVWSILDLFIS